MCWTAMTSLLRYNNMVTIWLEFIWTGNEIKNYKDEIIVISENIIYGIDPIPV